MLFKEKIFLANCDPVRQLSVSELEKRFLLGVTFAEGVILTPSLLLDNVGFGQVLKRRNLQKWYREEGSGTLVLRHPGSDHSSSMMEYFEQLPPGHRLARHAGKEKGRLTRLELADLQSDLKALDRDLRAFSPLHEPVALRPTSLTQALVESSTFADWEKSNGHLDDTLSSLREEASGLRSRSDWYRATEAMLGTDADGFKAEVVDTAYHGLFVKKGEAFAADRIAFMGNIPAPLLDAGLSIRTLRREKELLDYAIKGFDLVTAFGAGEITRFLAAEAADYIESKLQDTSMGWLTRRNWFGLYPRLTRSIGVEVR